MGSAWTIRENGRYRVRLGDHGRTSFSANGPASTDIGVMGYRAGIGTIPGLSGVAFDRRQEIEELVADHLPGKTVSHTRGRLLAICSARSPPPWPSRRPGNRSPFLLVRPCRARPTDPLPARPRPERPWPGLPASPSRRCRFAGKNENIARGVAKRQLSIVFGSMEMDVGISLDQRVPHGTEPTTTFGAGQVRSKNNGRFFSTVTRPT